MLIQNRSVEVFCGETRVKFFEKLSQFYLRYLNCSTSIIQLKQTTCLKCDVDNLEALRQFYLKFIDYYGYLKLFTDKCS